MRILITGGCGFIGAAVTRAAVDRGHRVLNIDRRRKTAPVPALAPVNGRPGYARLEADIADRTLMRALFNEFQPDRVIHLASAIKDDPDLLFDTDVAGAYSILEACRRHMERLDEAGRSTFRLVHATRTVVEAGRYVTALAARRGNSDDQRAARPVRPGLQHSADGLRCARGLWPMAGRDGLPAWLSSPPCSRGAPTPWSPLGFACATGCPSPISPAEF